MLSADQELHTRSQAALTQGLELRGCCAGGVQTAKQQAAGGGQQMAA
jgi:hypothetical protein